MSEREAELLHAALTDSFTEFTPPIILETAMTTEREAEQIAARLTEAQREIVKYIGRFEIERLRAALLEARQTIHDVLHADHGPITNQYIMDETLNRINVLLNRNG